MQPVEPQADLWVLTLAALHGLLGALKPDVNFCQCPIFGEQLTALSI